MLFIKKISIKPVKLVWILTEKQFLLVLKCTIHHLLLCGFPIIIKVFDKLIFNFDRCDIHTSTCSIKRQQLSCTRTSDHLR